KTSSRLRKYLGPRARQIQEIPSHPVARGTRRRPVNFRMLRQSRMQANRYKHGGRILSVYPGGGESLDRPRQEKSSHPSSLRARRFHGRRTLHQIAFQDEISAKGVPAAS